MRWRTSRLPLPHRRRLPPRLPRALLLPAAAAGAASGGPRRLVAVTACPTGIAHTYMAADSLVAAAKEVGVDLQVETQGSSGAKPLDPAVIAAADAVIFAVDVDVRGKERFAGKPVINAPVKRGIDEPAKMVQEALDAADNPHARRVPHFGAEEQAETGSRRKGRAHRPEAEEGAAHRRQLHDPVRGRRRPADRAGLPARRVSTSPWAPRPTTSWPTTPWSTFPTATSPSTSAPCSSRSAPCRWASWFPPWPATLPTRSPTVRASRRASLPVPSPASWAPASSAASSAACSPATSPT